ncbi:MAG: ComEA family DNA-binding protein [Acidimicrobiia bacterium]|nr:ComEA family DNA-binding protein [Acidimicrobiia bacterium]
MSQWIGVVALAAGALIAGVMFGGAPPTPPAVSFGQASPSGGVTVHVTGAVVSPGLVVLDDDARVADAVAAAGGLTPKASLTALNLATPLRDGMQVVVATVDNSPSGAGGIVSMSSASVEELAALPGVGPVLAQRIVDHREARGPFETMEDLLGVSGIGEAKLAAIRDVAVP